MALRRHARTLLPFSFLVSAQCTLPACTANPSSSNDLIEEDEVDLSGGSCVIGGACPESLPLLRAVSFPNGGPARLRRDVTIELGTATTARIARQSTSRVIRFASQDTPLTLKLRGPLPGAPIFVDDLLLFEVLDGSSGDVIAAAWAGGFGETKVTRAGVELSRLGRPGFEQEAGLVDLSSILPRDRPFRIRTSALDQGGASYVSDVFAEVLSNLPSAPTVETPWDPSWCEGPPITRAELLARFAPASTTGKLGRIAMNARRRTCHEITGCLAWEPAPDVPFNAFLFTGHHNVFVGDPTRVVATPATGSARLALERTTIKLTLALDDSDVTVRGTDPWGFSTIAFGERPQHFVGNDITKHHATVIPQDRQRLTNRCLWVESTGRVYPRPPAIADGTYTELQVVWHGTY